MRQFPLLLPSLLREPGLLAILDPAQAEPLGTIGAKENRWMVLRDCDSESPFFWGRVAAYSHLRCSPIPRRAICMQSKQEMSFAVLRHFQRPRRPSLRCPGLLPRPSKDT